jgi:hypothetical protein
LKQEIEGRGDEMISLERYQPNTSSLSSAERVVLYFQFRIDSNLASSMHQNRLQEKEALGEEKQLE